MLIESESDLKTLRRIASSPAFEANDMGAVRLLADEAGDGTGSPAPRQHLQSHDARHVLRHGRAAFVAPPEMSRQALAELRAALPTRIETEVFAYGRLPLAFSARCFTARHFNLQKDNCEFRCLEFADGITLRTREGEPFLTLNGIQTQSARVHNLLADLPSLASDGIDILRISPQGEHTRCDQNTFRDAIDRNLPAEALAASRPLMPEAPCNGFLAWPRGRRTIRH